MIYNSSCQEQWDLLQIIFEGVVGASYLGDIAIDDISLANGPCPPSGKHNL